jgi:hypothetical protein
LTHSTFDKVIEYHGEKLEQLIIHDTFHFHPDRLIIREDEAKKVAKYCPLLENFTLTIPRTNGDSKEVSIYKALGSIPRLRNLDLSLDAAYIAPFEMEDDDEGIHYADTPMPEDPSFDEIDQQVFNPRGVGNTLRKVRNGNLRAGLANGAFDKTLARAIFDTISTSKSCEKSGSRVILESLKVRTIGVCAFALSPQELRPWEFDSIVHVISRSWSFHRNPRDDRRNEIIIKDTTDEDNGNRIRWKPEILKPEVETVFRRVWPNTTNGDWTKDWHSFPLSNSSN